MACYAADLVAGNNLLCMSLKAGTILRYLQAAAELSIPANVMNPCLDITGKQSKYIRDIITEVRRWESMPDRREPVTKEMVECPRRRHREWRSRSLCCCNAGEHQSDHSPGAV